MMVFIVTLVFIVCWTPYHIVRYTNAIKMKGYMLYREMPTPTEVINFAIFNTVAQALVFLSSCCNPFIYAISSHNFSKLLTLLSMLSAATPSVSC
jgi:magnesium-transporting ATPase (P-type)